MRCGGAATKTVFESVIARATAFFDMRIPRRPRFWMAMMKEVLIAAVPVSMIIDRMNQPENEGQ
jgi:hypothetical protein